MEFELINTERLLLRKLDPEAYAHVFTHFNDDELKTFFGFATDAELEKERSRYQKGLCTFNKTFVLFQVIEKETGKVIGGCAFHTWYIEHNRAEIGYAMNSDAGKGKGFMSEVLPYVLEYGFTRMNLHRVEAFISPLNVPSLKLVQKNGFTQEGHLREHYLKDGIMEDSLVFSLLRKEYPSK